MFNKIQKIISTVLLLGLFLVATAQAAELKSIQTPNGPKWILKNNLVIISVDPSRGGRIDQFQDLKFKNKLIRRPLHQGLFIDHLAQQQWPGELWDRTYRVLSKPQKSNTVILELSTMFEGKFNSNAQPHSKGVLISKKYILQDSQRGITVKYTLTNTTSEKKQFSLWVQNILQLGEEPKKNISIRPTTAGIKRFVMPNQPYGEAWKTFTDSTDAWTGVIDPISNHGAIFFQDWDYLQSHYNAGPAYTVEWFMTPMLLLPGSSWSTQTEMVSLELPTDLVAISKKHWIAAKLNANETGINFSFDDAKPVKLTGILHEPRKGKKYRLNMKITPETKCIQLPQKCVPPIFLEGIFSYPKGEELSVNEYFGGKHFRVNEPLPGYPPLHKSIVPPKNPEFQRPDKIHLADNSSKRILLVQGIYHCKNIESILQNAGYNVKIATDCVNAKEAKIQNFPMDYDEILSFGAIVFNNSYFALFSPLQKQLLRDYINAGGKILILGGTSNTERAAENTFLKSILHDFSPSSTLESFDKFTTKTPSLQGVLPTCSYALTWTSQNPPLVTAKGNTLICKVPDDQGNIILCGLSGIGRTVPRNYWESPQWRELILKMLQMADMKAGKK